MDYNIEEVIRATVTTTLSSLQPYLDNGICSIGEKENADMPTRIKIKASINGTQVWITGKTQQDILDRYLNLCIKEGIVRPPEDVSDSSIPFVPSYVADFFHTFRSAQESLTVINRDRIIKNHIEPKFSDMRLDEITISVVQKWFDELAEKYSKETVLKIKNTISPAMDAAVEDGYISFNPFKSNRIEIKGKDSVHHKAIPKELMQKIKAGIPDLEPRQRYMCALLSYTGMRFEEVLGLRWEDIDGQYIHIERAVVHPTRNQPEVKPPKTKTSKRTIPIPNGLLPYLKDRPSSGFILSHDESDTPLSYTEAKRAFAKIQKAFGIQDYTAHDFRDTCATEWRESGMSLDLIARLLGHSKTETTEQRYVNYRDSIMEEAKMYIDA